MSLYTDLKDAGVPIDNHESDLYFLDSPEARAILARYSEKSVSRFTSQIDQKRWVEVPFAYDPWWEILRLTPGPVRKLT